MKLVANQTEAEINNGKVLFATIILGYLHINIPLRQKKEKKIESVLQIPSFI